MIAPLAVRSCEIVIDEKRGLALLGDRHGVWLRRRSPAPPLLAPGQGRHLIRLVLRASRLGLPLARPAAHVGLRAASAFASGEIFFKAGTGVLTTVDGIPFYLQAEALKDFISEELMASTTPIFFLTPCPPFAAPAASFP
jgi:hypothetical protein